MPLIRLALIADAIASGATGLLLALGGSFLAGLTGIATDIAMPLGLFLIVFAVFVAWVGTRRSTARGLAGTIVLVNAMWVIGSGVVLLAGTLPLTMLGIAFVIVQALAVAGLAALQWIGLGRAAALA
jgi:hypothetical protein